MRLVYEKAVLVRAWLDLEIDSTHPAFAQLSLLDERSSVQDLGEKPEFWAPVLALFPQRYWSRVWIQQELTCAVDFLIHCRRSCVSGHGFLQFARLVEDKYDARTSKTDGLPLYNAVSSFGAKNVMSLKFLWRNKSALPNLPLHQFQSHLLDLLDHTRMLQCTDPKDRVYALMYLAIDYEHGAISISYDLSVAQVYCSVAKFLIKKYKSLAFLLQITLESINSKHNLPTWVPDWDNALQPTYVIDMTNPSKLGLSPTFGQVIGRPPVISPCGKILQVQGFHVDSIMGICLDSWEELINEPISIAFGVWMSIAYVEPSGLYVVRRMADITQDQRSTLMRTLIAGNEFDEMESAFDEYCDFVDNPLQGNIPLSELLPELTEASVQFLHGMALTFQDRTLFKSGKGMVGLVPRDSQLNDEVWILFGCPTPIVLRQEDETNYIVVGMAYVDGIMKGEALQDMPIQVEEGCCFGDYEVCTINLR